MRDCGFAARTPPESNPQIERTVMAGMFELFFDTDATFKFRVTAPDGTVMAVSKAFDDKPSAVAGIAAMREYAGMGLITDLCPASAISNHPASVTPPHSLPPLPSQEQRCAVGDLGGRPRVVRRTAQSARWAGVG